MRHALFIRHADSQGNALTPIGRDQVCALSRQVLELSNKIHFAEWLVATSCQMQAVETALGMNKDSYMPLMVRRELAEANWDQQPDAHARDFIHKLEALGMVDKVEMIIVITHEKGPWHLAIAALESAQQPVPRNLWHAVRQPDDASGFLVDLQAGSVRKFSWDQPL